MSVAALEIVVLAVLVGDARPEVTDAMAAALREVLGPTVEVRVEPRESFDDGPPPADDTVEARVAWDHDGVVAMLHIRGLAQPIDRGVTFSAEDDPVERGRALGFVLAAALPALLAVPASAPSPSPHDEAPPVSLQPARPPSPAPPTRASSFWLTLATQGSLGLLDDGATTALGGALAGGWTPTPPLQLGLRLEARSGQLAVAQATTVLLAAKAGAAWSFASLGAGRPLLALGLRADLGVARDVVTHFSSDDPAPISHGRWTMVADVWLEATLRPRGPVGIVLGVGSDLAFGRVDVLLGDDRRATLEVVRPMAELGLRADL